MKLNPISLNPICDRCGKEIRTTHISMFNSDTCCMDCIEKERQHPDYEKAYRAALDAYHRGDYNFSGVGKPNDL